MHKLETKPLFHPRNFCSLKKKKHQWGDTSPLNLQVFGFDSMRCALQTTVLTKCGVFIQYR